MQRQSIEWKIVSELDRDSERINSVKYGTDGSKPLQDYTRHDKI